MKGGGGIKTNTKESRESSGITLKTYVKINWKIWKKWTIF
jgi:hypothetical protein